MYVLISQAIKKNYSTRCMFVMGIKLNLELALCSNRVVIRESLKSKKPLQNLAGFCVGMLHISLGNYVYTLLILHHLSVLTELSGLTGALFKIFLKWQFHMF